MTSHGTKTREDQMSCQTYEDNNPAVVADYLRWMANEIDRVCADAVRDSRIYYEVQTRTEGPVLRVCAFHRYVEVLAWAERNGTQVGEPEPGGYGDTRWVYVYYNMGDLPVEVTLFGYTEDAGED